MFGLVIAAAGVFLTHWTMNPVWDGTASIVIGVALAGVAVMLARESKGLLIGERADPAVSNAIRAAFSTRREVTRVQEIVTIHFAPRKIFVAASVDFEDAVSVGAIEQLIADTEAQLRREWPQIASVYIKPKASAAPIA